MLFNAIFQCFSLDFNLYNCYLSLNFMSENQFMIKKNNPNQGEEEANQGGPVLDAFEANRVNQQLVQESLRNNYKFLQFPCCGDYLEPNLKPIADKKTQLHKKFFEEKEYKQHHKLVHFDGVYDNIEADETSSKQLIRFKSRMVRDLRQQFFQQNSQLISDTQFFHNHLSRLANISTQNNQAISTFQKNAILSQRNNQKKNMPYELEVSIGQLWINKHQLQNREEIKFEELRPILKQFSNQSTYPILAEIQKEREYLTKVKERLLQSEATNQEIGQIIKKLELSNRMYKQEAEKLETLMQSIIRKWRQIKQQRKSSGLETVPWRLNIKEYEIDKHKSFDIGVTGTEILSKPLGPNGQAEIKRRQNIRQQKYFIKIYINGYEVAKSQKINLQWPSFRVPINSKFNMTVYSAPSSIQVEIIKAGLINRVIDTIHLTLPGVNSKTITASERRFAGAHFSNNGPKARKRQEEPTAPGGMLIYRIEWKGQGSRMPPVSFKSQQEETAATQQTEEDNIDYVELYDIKDPRFQHKGKRQEVEDQIIRAHGALLPFVDTQSIRHLLLKMKATQPQFEKLQIPLTQQEVRKRLDLLAVIENQKLKTLDSSGAPNEQIYNPMEGIFKGQQKAVLDEIKKILYRIQNLKINTLKGNSSARYKITEQIINQYVFEQMESPIVVFFKNLFTQKRKLGPKITYYLQAKNVIDNMEVNIHLRSAKNIPIREDVLEKLRNQEQNEVEQAERMRRAFQRMGGHTGNVDMYANYGMGFYQRPPNMNIQGQNFFVPGMINQNPNRMNFEANYQRQKTQRSNSFVMLRFKKLLKRTQCFQGPFPEWNQTIQFDYNLKQQQMTISKLYANNQKMMKLFLFDMVESSISTTAISNVNIKKTKYYLGRIDIPMSMLVAIPSITGLFAVERPLVIFGYGIKKTANYDNQPADSDESHKTQYPQIITLMNIDMFSDPLIDSMTAYNEDRKFVTGAHHQSTMLLQRSSDWLSDLNTKMYIRLWINNIEGRSVFICRYLTDHILPPPELENSIERCARFVSLIPRKYSCKLLENTEEFHLTCDQFLRIKMGQDHGILLCNFFNFIDKKAGRNFMSSSLILGKAFPYGKSMFVLRRHNDTGDCQIWDPYAGHCYFYPAKQYDTFCCFFRYSKKKDVEQQKDFCNMIEVGSIVTSTNVYVNAQDSLKPEDLDFNINDESLWKPFLSQRMRNEYFQHSIIETIQPPIDDNFYPKPRKMQPTVEKELKEYIETNMRAQRLKHFNAYTFRINHNISDAIYHKLLLKCQTLKSDFRLTGLQSNFYTAENKSKLYNDALNQIQQAKNKIKQGVDSDKTLYGFTLNLPFTTKKDIWQKIQQTQIHLNEVESIEFVVAVRCFEIACDLYSVWVFIGSIS